MRAASLAGSSVAVVVAVAVAPGGFGRTGAAARDDGGADRGVATALRGGGGCDTGRERSVVKGTGDTGDGGAVTRTRLFCSVFTARLRAAASRSAVSRSASRARLAGADSCGRALRGVVAAAGDFFDAIRRVSRSQSSSSSASPRCVTEKVWRATAARGSRRSAAGGAQNLCVWEKSPTRLHKKMKSGCGWLRLLALGHSPPTRVANIFFFRSLESCRSVGRSTRVGRVRLGAP